MIGFESLRQGLFIGIIFLMLNSCSNNHHDLLHYIQEIKARPGKTLAPIPQWPVLANFKFPEQDLMASPFKEKKSLKNEAGAPNQKRVKQSLEAYPLKSLKFVGILKQEHRVWALIQQPNKQVISVRVGDYIGQHDGRIIVIKPEIIKLVETINNAGIWEKKVTTIQLSTGN